MVRNLWIAAVSLIVLSPGILRAATLPADLAFIRDGHLQLLKATDGKVTELLAGQDCRHPSWSSDGLSLVFEQGNQIARLDLAKAKAVVLTTSGDCGQPAVHPTKPVIWYVRIISRPAGNEEVRSAWLWQIGLDGMGARRVDAVLRDDLLLGDHERTVWKRDGSLAALSFETGGEGGRPYFVDRNGHGAEVPMPRALAGAWAYGAPAWHPRWSMIAVPVLWRYDPDDPRGEFEWTLDVWRLGPDHRVRQVRDPPPTPEDIAMVQWPAFSPDGSALAYELTTWSQPSTSSVVVIRAVDDNRELYRLTDACQPAWRPIGAAAR